MTADVVDRHQRHAECERGCLCKIHPDQHRADQPRRIGDGNGINVAARQVRRFQRLIGKAIDRLNVLSRGNFRHHAAVEFVDLDLRGDAVGQDLPPVADNGNGGLVAGGFNR